MRLYVTFLNCYNLFPAGTHPSRGPRTRTNLTSKINDLAATIRRTCRNLPDIIALCEVGDETLGHRLSNKLVGSAGHFKYEPLWSDPPTLETGLMVLYNPGKVILQKQEGDLTTRGAAERPKWLAMLFQLQSGSCAPFWLVVNHWKSQMGGELNTEPARINSASEIGQFYLDKARVDTDHAILIGDFNCEPASLPFRKPSNYLRAVRERALVLRDGLRLAYFYNPMWRLYGEPDDFDKTQRPRSRAPRPVGTHLGDKKDIGWELWDQIMVSKRLLQGRQMHFLESSLRIVQSRNRCSDHCAISAVFEF